MSDMNEFMKFMDTWGRMERESKYRRYRKLNELAEKKQVVFAGSSLCEQFPISEILMNTGSSRIIYNRGVSGDTTEGLSANLDACVLDLDPSKIFINIGSNDIGSPGYVEEDLLKRYKVILERIRAEVPEAVVHVLSWYPVNPVDDFGLPEEHRTSMFATRTNAAIDAANRSLKVMAEAIGCTFINVSDVLKDENGNLRKEYAVEGLHMWPEAYMQVYGVLKDWL